ncbi:acyl-CoA dehydrogenase NM domain-like protein [Dentipellis sp. KUC8613]|nr:acyl-CoA dehydrogenase NM domain-like protein [Dentipellis sp. KUC8613]
MSDRVSSPLQPSHLAESWAHSPPLSYRESTLRSVQRARELVRAHGLTVEDVAQLSPAFWGFHYSPLAPLDGAVATLDGAAATLAAIQINLVAGTLSRFAEDDPSLLPLIRKLLCYETMGQFCLTEVGHGLDAINLETAATLLPDGTFELHTPHMGAAKYMPPTNPCGIPCVAIVFARLIVDGANHGIRPFLVPLNDGHNMHRGITARILPAREGSTPLNHCVTSFDRVKLPANALLGDIEEDTSRFTFFNSIWRVAVGTLSLTGLTLSCLAVSPFIVARYSQRRTVAGPGGSRIPVISFRTQHGPILTALAQGFVLKEMWNKCTAIFAKADLDPRLLHALATIFKVTTTQHVQAANLALSERCGAQGLFAYNQISELYENVRGNSIAEGDTLVISIRLASELILERYELEASTHPSSLLARHEQDLLDEHKALLRRCGHHRSDEFNRLFLPSCENIVRAIGHRMAYDAAVDAGLDPTIVAVYLASAVKLDSAWYSEKAGFSRVSQALAEDKALSAALPHLEEWLSKLGVEAHVTAPIVSDDRWNSFVGQLEARTHEPTYAEPLLSRL